MEIDLGREDFSALINQMPFLLTGAHLISPGDLGAFRTKVEAAGGRARIFGQEAAALRRMLEGDSERRDRSRRREL
ncbi:MAG: hypothetical protein WDM79_06785 [Terricaulis sp.]